MEFRLDKETRIELAKDHLVGGWSFSRCGREYGVSRSTARRYVQEYLANKEQADRYPSGRKRYPWKAKPKLKPCGTDAAYQRHKRSGQYPCTPCLEAHAESVESYKRKKKNLSEERAA